MLARRMPCRLARPCVPRLTRRFWFQSLDQWPDNLLADFSVMTHNIHCPAHKRLPDGTREASNPNLYIPRNQRILEMLRRKACEIICLQEMWVDNQELVAMYRSALEEAGYQINITPRTNARGDGLMTAVSPRLHVVDSRHIPFRDVADRVAQLLHLKGVGSALGEEELLLLNVHLMFPHDQNATVIRLRQCAKLLGNLAKYTEKNHLSEIPVVICGDWNGSSKGHIAGFMKSQGFISVYDELNRGGPKWVSHLNHNQQVAGVDAIYLLNPSAQAGAMTAEWRPAAYASIAAQLAMKGFERHTDAFDFFDTEGKGVLDYKDFARGVEQLGLTAGTGPESVGLLKHEVRELAQWCDWNGNGVIEREELQLMIDLEGSIQLLKDEHWNVADYIAAFCATSCPLKSPFHPNDLQIRSATLPSSFAKGVWPEGFTDRISDHAPLMATLRFPRPEQWGWHGGVSDDT